MTIIWVMTNDCNYHCANKEYGCIAGCQLPKADRRTRIEFDDALAWHRKYFPSADIHITGGEPLLLPDIDEGIKKVIAAGHRVSIFTNASLLRAHPALWDLPIVWHLTYHPYSVPINDFLDQIEPVKDRPHVVIRVIGKEVNEKELPERAIFEAAGHNFKYTRNRRGYIGEEASHTTTCPNDTMMIIGKDGSIHPCSKDLEIYGNIKDLTFDRERAARFRCPRWPVQCTAARSVEILAELQTKIQVIK